MRKFVICLCAAYLIGSFQSIGTAAELEGLVVYFAFEEGAGKTVKDLSGNGQDGKLEGDTSWGDGKYGKLTSAEPTLQVGPSTWQLIAMGSRSKSN